MLAWGEEEIFDDGFVLFATREIANLGIALGKPRIVLNPRQLRHRRQSLILLVHDDPRRDRHLHALGNDSVLPTTWNPMLRLAVTQIDARRKA